MKLQIGVIGFAGEEEYPKGKGPNQKHLELAYETGKIIGEQKWILLTGGKGGVMAAASKGAQEKNCIVVGFIRGSKRFESNSETDVEIVTGFEVGGSEFTLVHSSDAIIAIGGGAGTIQEIALAYRLGKPIFVLGSLPQLNNASFLDERKTAKIEYVENPEQAIQKIKKHFSQMKKIVKN